MLVQNLINEATKKEQSVKQPKSSTTQDYSHIAPSFHDQAADKYANVLKFIKILGHAEHLSRITASASVGSKEIKITIIADSNDGKGDKAVYKKRLLAFWSKVGKYFENIPDGNVVFGFWVNFGGSERIPATEKNVVDYIKKDLAMNNSLFYTKLEFAIPNSKKKPKSEHDYDAILKDVKTKNQSKE